MRCIHVNNVNQGLSEGLKVLLGSGKTLPSRNGAVLALAEPLSTTYYDPCARVLFSPLRDANPFFHYMEGLWMLAGRNDLAFLKQFVSTFGQFSDDGHTIHGAYGYRWRMQFQFDQLPLLIDELKRDPFSRRAVLTMWDPQADFNNLDGKDVPCNTHIYFTACWGKLDMTVCCRSNDALWGAYGANAVHMSMLMEYVAAALDLPVGHYTQMSNNMHVYLERFGSTPFENIGLMADSAREHDLYTKSETYRQPRLLPADHPPKRVALVSGKARDFMDALDQFMDEPGYRLTGEPSIDAVAVPMYRAWQAYKEERHTDAFQHAMMIKAGDWSIACVQWLERRAERRANKANLEA